jgi:hypothetical protein
MIEDFLSRWSRRKQAAAQAAEPAKPPSHDESAAAPEHAAGPGAPVRDESCTAQSAPESCAPVFDPASLPPIESITAETDIRAFFAAGVPAELTRAALRRVWTSDPKIRDFVGLADYDWDFNAPGSMAGFGPLEGADALRAQMARRIGPLTAENDGSEMSGRGPGAEQEAPVSDASVHDRPVQPTQIQIMTEDEPSRQIGASQEGDESTRPDREYVAAQQQEEKPESVQSIARRRHGRALPEA